MQVAGTCLVTGAGELSEAKCSNGKMSFYQRDLNETVRFNLDIKAQPCTQTTVFRELPYVSPSLPKAAEVLRELGDI